VVQVSTLLSIKQVVARKIAVVPTSRKIPHFGEGNDLMSVSQVKAQALRAKSSGSSRVCMGAAWRNVKDGPEFDQYWRWFVPSTNWRWKCAALWYDH
jgi:biotin synthase